VGNAAAVTAQGRSAVVPFTRCSTDTAAASRIHRKAACWAAAQVECDHGRLKARLRPMRGLKQDRSARVIIAGHAFVQNLRRGHYELVVEEPANRRVAAAFDELVMAT
jgi:transposase-like protein